MIVKKIKYIFLLIFTLQNYNFYCEECCNCWEECWNNCWNKSTNVQNSSLQGENSQEENSQGENIINNDFALWKSKDTTKFETTDIKSGICIHDNFDSGNGFPYYEQFYIPTKKEIQKKRATSFYQDIHNYQNIIDFTHKNGNYCVIVKNIFPYCKKDKDGNDNNSNLVYCVSVFLIYKKNAQNVYELESDKAFFIFNITKNIYYLSENGNEYVNSWNEKIKEKIESNLQNLENIRNNISDIGAIFNIDFSKKNVSNIIYNNEVGNIIDENFDLNKIKQNDNDGSCWRKGLANIGATCYMNATLQCFAHIPEFVTFFRQNQQVQGVINKKVETNNLTGAFAELLQNLYPTNLDNMKDKTYYEPNNFKNTISQLNPLFEGIAANDAKDLVNFLIMTLHEELNKANSNQNNNNNNNNNEFNIDQRNENLMFNSFINFFINTNQSIISDLFYAVNCNTTQCCNCNVTSYNYQIYFFLIFPLEEVRKFKLYNNGVNNNGSNNNFNNNFNLNNNVNDTVDIYDCFNYDKRDNTMEGDNSMYCNYCKHTCPCYMSTNLVTGPEIFILILNRGKGIEFNVKLNFYEDLNLSNYIELKDTGTQYELFGVITHIGESGMGGHFIAYCKDLWDNNTWYKYNDAIVDKVEDFQKEVVNFAMPYLLFYKKTDNHMFRNNNKNVIFQINNILQNNNNNILQNNNMMMNPQFNYMFPNNNNMFSPFNNMMQNNNMFPQGNNMNFQN